MPNLKEERKFVEDLLARSRGAEYLPLTAGEPQKQRAPVPLQIKEVLQEGREWTKEHLPGLDEILAQAIIELATGGLGRGIAPAGSLMRAIEEAGLTKLGGRVRIIPRARRKQELYKLFADSLAYALRYNWNLAKGRLRDFMRYSTPTMKSMLTVADPRQPLWTGVHMPGGYALASPSPLEAALHALRLVGSRWARRLGKTPEEIMGRAEYLAARGTQQHEFGHRLQTALNMLNQQYGKFLTSQQKRMVQQLESIPREYFAESWSAAVGPRGGSSMRLRPHGKQMQRTMIHPKFLEKGIRRSRDAVNDFETLVTEAGVSLPTPAKKAIAGSMKKDTFDFSEYARKVGMDPVLKQWGEYFRDFHRMWRDVPEFLRAPGAR